MSKRIAELAHQIGQGLGALPEVFSTPQWGGRAFKLPGPNGDRRKPKLLAHLWLSERDERVEAVCVSFRLPPPRARVEVKRREWIEPHAFRTLAPSGWMTATIRSKPHAQAVLKLLKESHAIHPGAASAPRKPRPKRNAKAAAPPLSGEARRIERVMAEFRDRGWTPS